VLYVVADARRPPLRPGSMDLITIISLLEHVLQWGDVIESLERSSNIKGS
jgi:ubiquinone/menaquinone biosynthesis C-methylase UbiE